MTIGERLEVARITVAYYESGKNNVNKYMTRNICKTFNVNYLWLTEGKSEMFMDKNSEAIEKLMSEYNIDPSQLPLIKAYLNSSAQTKAELLSFALLVQEEHKKSIEFSLQSSTLADELLKYKQLLDSGAINEEEHNILKKKLLK